MKMLITSQHQWIFVTCLLVSHFSTQCYAYVENIQIKFCVIGDSLEDFRKNGKLRHFAIPMDFGPPFPNAPERFEGMVVLTNPEDGCQSIAPPPNTTDINVTGKWIAFMKSGNCDFAVKARNAQNANYDMALIYNQNTKEEILGVNCDPKYPSRSSAFYLLRQNNETLNCSDTSDINILTVNTYFSMAYVIKEIAVHYKRNYLLLTQLRSEPVYCTNYYKKAVEQESVKNKKTVTGEKVPTPRFSFLKLLFEFLFPFSD